MSAVKNSGLLSGEQMQYAYQLGVMDRALNSSGQKSFVEVLQNGTESDKIKENAQEGAENEQGEEGSGVRLRGGGERDGGQNPGGQVSSVEGGTRQDQSGREAQRRPADAAAASGLDLGEEVSAKSFEIKGGIDSAKVKRVKEGSESPAMKQAREMAEARGLKVTFFTGGNLKIRINGKIASVRGYIEGDRVFIRVDHPKYTADQLMRHEICHDMIDNGEIDINEVRERIKALGVDVEYFIDRYSEAYALSGAIMGPEDVWVEIICDSYGDMNEFASVAELSEMNTGFLSSLKGEVEASRKDARGPPKSSEGRASAEFGQYTKEQYENFGWVRANNVINAGYWRNFTENFAQAVSGLQTYPKAKNGDFMIDVYDAYDSTDIADVIVFASGTIESPNISKLIKINSSDSIEIEETRRDIYAFERRGIQCKARELFDIYSKADVIRLRTGQANGQENARHNNRLDIKRRSSEVKANRIVEFHIDEERNTVTTTYANGETVTESLGGHASQDLDFFDYLNENAEDAEITESETVEERELSNREFLANALESMVKTEADKKTLRQYKRRAKALDAMEAELKDLNAKIRELSFATGPRDKVTLTKLKEQKAELEKKIHTKDKALLMLEASAPLQKVLERAKKQATDKVKAKAREDLAAQKARAKDALDKQATHHYF